MRPPVTGLERNILRGRGGLAAVYRVATVSYELLTEQAKLDELAAWAWLAQAVETDGCVMRLGRAYPADRYVPDTESMCDRRHADPDRWRAYLAAQQERIEQADSHEPEVYVALRLKPARRRTRVGQALPPTRDAILEAERHALATVTEFFPARRAAAAEIVWAFRRAPMRALGEPPMDQHWNPAGYIDADRQMHPAGSEFARFFDYELARESHGFHIETEHGTSWQTVLAVGATPEEWEFPGGELMFAPLERYGGPVDSVTHWRWVPNERMHKIVRGRVMDADVAFTNQAHHMLSFLPGENRERARDAEKYYATQPHPPGLLCSRFVVVAATSRDERERRVAAVRKAFGSVRLERPPFAKQLDAYLDTLPGVDRARVMDYAEYLRLEEFGSMMPHGTYAVGDSRGVYFGLAHGRPVRRDPRAAAQTNRSPASLYAGALGSGKTLTAEKVAAEDALSGSQCVVLDPNATWFLADLPELEGMVHEIEVAATDRNRGLLDPLVITPGASREDRTTSFLADLLRGAPFGWELAIREAVQQVLQDDEHPGCLKVIEVLARGNAEAKTIARALTTFSRSGLASLGFSDGDPGRVGVEAPMTIIRPAGLVLPDMRVDREHYDQIEVTSVGVLKLMAVFAMRAVDSDRSRHKRVSLDEAHIFISSPDGRRVIQDLNTTGRAKNASLDLITQRLSPEVLELQELMASRYIFGQESESQAEVAAELLGMDPADHAVIRRLRGLRDGRCLYRDLQGRIADTQVDMVFAHWLRILDTKPGAERVAA